MTKEEVAGIMHDMIDKWEEITDVDNVPDGKYRVSMDLVVNSRDHTVVMDNVDISQLLGSV